MINRHGNNNITMLDGRTFRGKNGRYAITVIFSLPLRRTILNDTNMTIFNKFPRTFWVANTIELFERWAWYGFFMLFANYLTGSSDLGGLEFSQSQKGLIMGVGTGILYFLPVLTGAIADRYGYKRVLALAFVIYASAFALFPLVSSFAAVFSMYIYLALGAALFKPVISATIAKTTTNETSSIGFGIFYMMVNIGAFFGPMVTLLFKGQSQMIFYVSALIILVNFILLLFYKEPKPEVDSETVETRQQRSLLQDFAEIFRNMASILKDPGFLVFLLIVAGFWSMYYQLFFTLPVFISQWVDTSVMYHFFDTHIPFFSANYSVAPGVMDAEFVTNMDALYIILLQIVVSTIVMRWKPLHSMMAGFLVCSVGMALTLFSQNVLFTLVALLVFSIGEMSGSPKITEYIGRIAPKDKKALYMGYSFIPVFLGSNLAGIISGSVYQAMSDKVVITKKFAIEKGLQIADGLTSNEYFNEVARLSNMSASELTDHLWNTYNPSSMWMVIMGVGVVAAVCLFIYDKKNVRT
jgi:dipeptide/tripeptide permease